MKVHILPKITLPLLAVRKLITAPLPTEFTVRELRPDDRDRCLEIYRVLEPGRFPPNDECYFTATIDKADHSLLVIEHNNHIVACGGISHSSIGATLFYGLIHPDFQRRGLGRLLLLSRLARLTIDKPICVLICAVESSISYYEQFHFMKYALWPSSDGSALPQAGAYINPKDCTGIRDFLTLKGHKILPPIEVIEPSV
jgi:GNAT superfamily N-acetyltransferase